MRNKAEIELYTKDMMEVVMMIPPHAEVTEEHEFMGKIIIRDCQQKISDLIEESQNTSPAMSYLHTRWQ